ncbi:unnamed protein product [Symbiodinium natans]|uniref:Uncharacterized protein n=1 Tax=Symbiodinium natans TaxID=878477 RepID=A0A812QJP3_9DINO|nr:unnamed protein product [Symbiodinium natans]
MALQHVVLVLLVVEGSQAQNATSADPPVALGDLIHCPCGVKCLMELGRWHIFNVGQSCMCQACSAETNLRGSDPKQAAHATPTAEEKTVAEEFLTWDSGLVPASNLLYCRCGRNGWGGCKPCRMTCPCGKECVDWVQGIYGAPAWCIEHRCTAC